MIDKIYTFDNKLVRIKEFAEDPNGVTMVSFVDRFGNEDFVYLDEFFAKAQFETWGGLKNVRRDA